MALDNDNDPAANPSETVDWGFIKKMRDQNPYLYGAVIIVLGLASAFAIYQNVFKSPRYSELLAFAGFCVFLYAVGVVVAYLFRETRFKVVLSAIIVIGGLFVYGGEGLNKTLSDTSQQFYPTILCWISASRCTPPPKVEAEDSQVEVDPSAAGADADDTPMVTSPVAGSPQRVYLQFAGALDRNAEIVPFVSRLAALGWTMQDTERIAAAAGLYEVRYFHEEDRENAERLVAAITASDPPVLAGNLPKLRYFSNFSNVSLGNLEIWMSK
ncbi:hypothetical protein [Hoeflea ulvae]|uniref:Uncharacterized protein n=1 Tax=Hoeflea ulvae TaxID=2983764 RepID=A0ABT3YG36_9HYPH|nr:hypothetical protein [Hoeflea ulvae]MCY0094864.1 hypothetical protein [Hoeflea ulvae]